MRLLYRKEKETQRNFKVAVIPIPKPYEWSLALVMNSNQ